MEVGDIPEGSIALKIPSDHIFSPERPRCYNVSNQRGMERAAKPGASDGILTPKCDDNILLPARVNGSRNQVTTSRYGESRMS